MKVFISWSGSLSKRVAAALRDWLPTVLQAVEPWMSAEDIEKGARWGSDVAVELSKTKAGILCVTADNVDAPWLNFEAGALSKTLEKTFVSPYLVGLTPTDLTGPLVQFQATESSKLDTRRLMSTLNKALGDIALPDEQLDKTFERWWPELESALREIQSAEVPEAPRRDQREILEEILALVRDQGKRNVPEVFFAPTVRSIYPRGAVGLPDYYFNRPVGDLLMVEPVTGQIVTVGEAKAPEPKPEEPTADDKGKGLGPEGKADVKKKK
ncbi:MAG: hypothetical protein DMG22_20315 [Acidobacteria bacterium]|nr:MAG: hypothetical protein DMG22_20315 [Acidobacteriota bacterium]